MEDAQRKRNAEGHAEAAHFTQDSKGVWRLKNAAAGGGGGGGDATAPGGVAPPPAAAAAAAPASPPIERKEP